MNRFDLFRIFEIGFTDYCVDYCYGPLILVETRPSSTKTYSETIFSRISLQVAYRNNANNPSFLSFSTTSDTRFFPIAKRRIVIYFRSLNLIFCLLDWIYFKIRISLRSRNIYLVHFICLWVILWTILPSICWLV